MTVKKQIEAAIKQLIKGGCIILVDDESRENEGDLVCAGEKITPKMVNFMATHARGLICLALSPERVEQLQLPLMTSHNRSRLGTGFTVSIEAAEGVTTGISAYDRAHTIKVASQANVKPSDVVSPGHIFPLLAKPLGVLERLGQTEGSVDLMRLAGLQPAAVICEIMSADGRMARRPELQRFAKKHRLPFISIQQLIQYRLSHEIWVKESAEAKLPTDDARFTVKVFEDLITKEHHLALIAPSKSKKKLPLVRMHSECLTGDALGSSRCDCGWQLAESRRRIAEEGGILLYLRQEGRGIGLINKIKAYALQDKGSDTVEANRQLGLKADLRDYRIAAQILQALNLSEIALLTNNPHKILALEYYGVHVKKRIPLSMTPTADNQHYLKTKQKKLGHFE